MSPLNYIFNKFEFNSYAWIASCALVWLATGCWKSVGWMPKTILVNPYNGLEYLTFVLLFVLAVTSIVSRAARWLLTLTIGLLSLQHLVFAVLLTLLIENNIKRTHNRAKNVISERGYKMRNIVRNNRPTIADILIAVALISCFRTTTPDSWLLALTPLVTNSQIDIGIAVLGVLMIFSQKTRIFVGFIIASQSILAGVFCLVLLFLGKLKNNPFHANTTHHEFNADDEDFSHKNPDALNMYNNPLNSLYNYSHINHLDNNKTEL